MGIFGPLGILASVLAMIAAVVGTQRLRRQEWEGTVVGRLVRVIWILTSSGEVRYMRAKLPRPFGKTLKIGDHLVKHRGVLRPEVTPQDWDDLDEDTKQKVLEASKGIEPEKSSRKSRVTGALILGAIYPVIIVFSMLKAYYDTHGLVAIYVGLPAIVLSLIMYVWLILWIRRQ